MCAQCIELFCCLRAHAATEDSLRHKLNLEIENFRATMQHELSGEFFRLHRDNSRLHHEHLVHPKSLEHFPDPSFSVRVSILPFVCHRESVLWNFTQSTCSTVVGSLKPGSQYDTGTSVASGIIL